MTHRSVWATGEHLSASGVCLCTEPCCYALDDDGERCLCPEETDRTDCLVLGAHESAPVAENRQTLEALVTSAILAGPGHTVTLPASGAFLVIDGKIYRVHDGGTYKQMGCSWRVRWGVTTDPEPMEGS